MNREAHVRNCEGVGVKLPRVTRLRYHSLSLNIEKYPLHQIIGLRAESMPPGDVIGLLPDTRQPKPHQQAQGQAAEGAGKAESSSQEAWSSACGFRDGRRGGGRVNSPSFLISPGFNKRPASLPKRVTRVQARVGTRSGPRKIKY